MVDSGMTQALVAQRLGLSIQRVNQLLNYNKNNARCTLSKAIKAGKISRADSCQDCKQKTRTHGHHNDYGLPLQVDWLCSSCHGERHKKQ